MAIQGPTDLPAVLRVRSDPLKKFVNTSLGAPNVEVEITEDQFETILRTTCDWLAGYFPREQKLALFWTQPLVSTYPMPRDAYWIQEVSFDPVTTRLDDVFGAEAYLFCVAPSFKVLDKDGSLQPLIDWKSHWKAKTPYGNSKLTIKRHSNCRPLPKVRLTHDGGVVEATSSHILAIPPGPPTAQRWREFGEIGIGDLLCGVDGGTMVRDVTVFESSDAMTPRAVRAGCYYGCTDGDPVLLH